MLARVFGRNVHPVERVVRVLAGGALVALAVAGPAAPWGWIGVIPVLTGLAGNCPLYGLLGFSTCRVKTAR